MSEMKAKTKNNIKPEKTKGIKKEVPKEPEEKEEEEVKEGGALSDGVLDAFEETIPVTDPLIEEEALLEAEDDEDELDYNPSEW